MNTQTFNKLLDELDGNSLETLKQKNAKYASENDCLHYCTPSNFDDLACRTCVATTSNHRGSNFVKKEN